MTTTAKSGEALIRVKVRLVGAFRDNRPAEAEYQFPAQSTIGQVATQLRLPSALLGIYLLNGVHATAEDCLRDGDSLAILPILDGG